MFVRQLYYACLGRKFPIILLEVRISSLKKLMSCITRATSEAASRVLHSWSHHINLEDFSLTDKQLACTDENGALWFDQDAISAPF